MPDPNPNAENIIELAAQLRAALDRKDLAALNRLIDAYKDIYQSLQGSIEALSLEIASGEYTRTSLIRYMRYQDLLDQTSERLRDFQGMLTMEIKTVGHEAVAMGETQARQLLSTTLIGNPGIAGQFQRLPADAIETLLGFLDPGGPLYARIKMLTPNTVDMISQAILDGLAKGLGSKVIARNITNGLGMGLTDALRMTRTVQNYAYRESSRASYLANSDVVMGWQWFAQLDERTCMSCISQHGKIFPLSQNLNDHHNGRCTELPVVSIFGPTIPEDAGGAWFDTQGEAMQRKMMGRGMFDAWEKGRIDLSQLSIERDNDVFGKMRGVPALKDLLGGK